MTGKDIAGLRAASTLIPPGTRVNVTFLGPEDLSMRLAAATAVGRSEPVGRPLAQLLRVNATPVGLTPSAAR
jgi:5,10-methylene-tetrahydrofolate dehydrogenase/methenyl tetrahydrofolate cyclohydrolase